MHIGVIQHILTCIWALCFWYFIFKILCVFFHNKFSPIKIPTNFIALTLSILWLFIFNFSRGGEMLYSLFDLWNNENLVFSTFSNSLFAENHFLVLIINSSLTILNNVVMSLCPKNKLVSSANIIGTSKLEELGRSFTYDKSNSSPNTLPWGTLNLLSFFTVSTDSVILIYFFLSFK